MPLFRRKNSSVPPPASQPQTQHQQQQQQQHWVAYVYAPQPVPMPSMYASGPYVQHPAFHHALPAARYNHLGIQYRTMPVQYIYPKSAAAHPNTHPQTDYSRKPHRSQSGARPILPGDYSYSDNEYAVEIRTQPAKQGVFSSLVNFARGRSKSRGRNEVDPTARPRSRGSLTDDGHARERGRTTDPRYVDGRPKRPLSRGELKRAKHDSQRSFEQSMMVKLEESLRDGPLKQDDPYRTPTSGHPPSSSKEALRQKYEAEDRLQRQREEYQRSQPVQIPSMRPSPRTRNPAASPDGLAESPTLIEHTKLNARQLHRQSTDSGYHTDVPPRSSRRASVPLQMMASPIEKTAAGLKIPEGFFNMRGDQLMNSKGDVLRRPPHLEFPPEFANYPPPGTGWMDHRGQVSY